MSTPSTSTEYLPTLMYQDEAGKQCKLESTWITECQCMIIGSYGDKYSSQVKDKVVPKESSKPGGKFLGGVTDDLEIVQEMIMKDHRKHLAYVLPDVPGAQRPRSHYISKIEVFLKDCQKSGALIWYTGHGEKMTGNWCFKDGVISMEDIVKLYQQYFSGRLLHIVSDCCYSGQWVYRLADKLDNLKIGACGHQASKAGLALKIFAACQHNETAFDTVYAKECVSVEPTNHLIVFTLSPVEIKHCGRLQSPINLDTTKTTCFSDQNEKLCRLDQIPPKVLWSWKDLMGNVDRNKRLELRLFKVWGRKDQQPYWYFTIIFDDKFEDFCQVAKSGRPYDLDFYGHTVFSGYGMAPPPEIERLFSKCGPVSVDLPKDKPATPGSHVHLQ